MGGVLQRARTTIFLVMAFLCAVGIVSTVLNDFRAFLIGAAIGIVVLAGGILLSL